MGLRTAGPVLLLAALLALPAAAAARTGPALRSFPVAATASTEAVFADGARYVVVQTAPDVVRVYDVEKRSSYDLAVGAGCRLEGAAPGVALLVCPSTGPHAGSYPQVIRLKERRVERARGSDPQASDERWHAIGRHWIVGGTTAMAHSVELYLNWRTGERDSWPDPYEFNGHLDIDDPKLRAYPDGIFDRNGSLALGHRANGLWLLRRGRDARLTASGAHAWQSSTQLIAGLVTWSEPGGVVRAYDARARVRLGWRTGGSAATISHTRKHVVVVTGGEQDQAPRILWARVRK